MCGRGHHPSPFPKREEGNGHDHHLYPSQEKAIGHGHDHRFPPQKRLGKLPRIGECMVMATTLSLSQKKGGGRWPCHRLYPFPREGESASS